MRSIRLKLGRYDDISGNSSYTAMAFQIVFRKILYPYESKRY